MGNQPTRSIVAFGAGSNPRFIKYVADLTGKSIPRLCFLPTAVGDNAANINNWYELCVSLNVKPYVQRMFISSYDQQQSFEEVLLSMDAIVVSGGNTLNMLAIWKAHGVDKILRTAWERGIVLCGGSAGSLCWFEQGTTDSRPKEITTIEGLGFIPASNCPHYDSEPTRRPLYHHHIANKIFKPGYACDDRAAIHFEGTQVKEAIVANDTSNAYYVYEENGVAKETVLERRVLG